MRAGRKSARGGWISRGLGKGNDRYQNMATGKAEVGQQIGQVRGLEVHGEGSTRAGQSGGHGRVRWIAEEGGKQNRAQTAE